MAAGAFFLGFCVGGLTFGLWAFFTVSAYEKKILFGKKDDNDVA